MVGASSLNQHEEESMCAFICSSKDLHTYIITIDTLLIWVSVVVGMRSIVYLLQ